MSAKKSAMTLQAQQNQLPVIEAVGGAENRCRRLQYAADYANAILQGKTETEAAALAASNQAKDAAQARVAILLPRKRCGMLQSDQAQQAAAAAVTRVPSKWRRRAAARITRSFNAGSRC